MTVSIIGAGSIGLLFAAYIRKAGCSVSIYTRTAEQARQLNNNGLYLVTNEQTLKFTVNADPLREETILRDPIIIVAVKQHQLHKLVPTLQSNSVNKTYLFIQNGMGHLRLMNQLNESNPLVGVVEHGAIKTEANKVVHTGYGRVKIAPLHDVKDQEKQFIQSWHHAQFPLIFTNDWYSLLATKLVANAVINPLTAIFRVKNGELIRNPYYLELMKRLFTETTSVLHQQSEDLWSYVYQICEQTSDNESSMFKDIQAGRKTEIDAINGYILSLADEQNKHLPLNEFVVTSIKGLENESD